MSFEEDYLALRRCDARSNQFAVYLGAPGGVESAAWLAFEARKYLMHSHWWKLPIRFYRSDSGGWYLEIFGRGFRIQRAETR